MHIHLDPLGGLSGDMFIAAMLDAMPHHWPDVRAAIEGLDLGPEAACTLVAHQDKALTGRRFVVASERHAPAETAHLHRHRADHEHGHDHQHAPAAHGHRAWAEIRGLIERSRLGLEVKRDAAAIFRLLAEAEASVHGVDIEEVTFHEVGAIDSIVDIVAAAQLIGLSRATSWSSAPLPLGSGRVHTAHGVLPVPAPATAVLLRGLAVLDDGISGERVTPTGAAIARHLLGHAAAVSPSPARSRRLAATGTGFGTRTLPGIANCLRVLVFDDTADRGSTSFAHRELGVISFEVDDQSAEDLAAGLEHIRAFAGVHDAIQSVAFGKKGRMATHVQVLVAPDRLEQAIAACFEETTTIGLRYHLVHGAALPRTIEQVEAGERALRVKAVRRPEGLTTAKAEAADVSATRGHAARMRLRRAAETLALDRIAAGSRDNGERS